MGLLRRAPKAFRTGSEWRSPAIATGPSLLQIRCRGLKIRDGTIRADDHLTAVAAVPGPDQPNRAEGLVRVAILVHGEDAMQFLVPNLKSLGSCNIRDYSARVKIACQPQGTELQMSPRHFRARVGPRR